MPMQQVASYFRSSTYSELQCIQDHLSIPDVIEARETLLDPILLYCTASDRTMGGPLEHGYCTHVHCVDGYVGWQ